MIVFADTSALFALLVHDDYMHVRARANFERFLQDDSQLLTSSYVLLETLTLLQRRVSLEAVWDFNLKLRPILDVIWVDEGWHNRALQRLHSERNRTVSLTDCLSFEIMEAREITMAFTFDRHFTERGFETTTLHDLDADKNGEGSPPGH
jgi:predicted nucleic acid-binding protein